jgi:hypothetical protein
MTETKRVVASAAPQLLGYITFRARREGQPHELPLEYYQEHLNQRVRPFFGVVTGPGMDQRIFCRLAEMGGFVKIILIQ